MASYLRPRRGKKATAESQAIVLKKGEVFFEVPTTGVGTGAGKIKMGDGVTAYSSLPYFSEEIPKVEDAVIGFTDSNTETAASNNSTYLTNIKPANSLKTIFTNLKQLLYNYNAEITQLNNDFGKLSGIQVFYTKSNGGSDAIFAQIPILQHEQARYSALFIGNGNSNPYIECCTLCNLGATAPIYCSITNISNHNLSIHSENINQWSYDIVINSVANWGYYSLLIFNPDIGY